MTLLSPTLTLYVASFYLGFVFNNHSQAQLLSNSYSDDDDDVDDYDSYNGYDDDDTTTTTSTISTPTTPRDRDDDPYSYDSYEDGDLFNDSLSGKGNMDGTQVCDAIMLYAEGKLESSFQYCS